MKKEKKLYFLPELLAKIKTGEKTETRRLFKIFAKGDIVKAVTRANEKDFVFIKVLDCKLEFLSNMTIDGARKEGFESVEEFKKTWNEINERLKTKWLDNPKVNVIVFEFLAEEGA